MAVNKNFVVKNGIEVATDLIYATSDLDKVGIGSTIPTSTLEVGGDFKATGNSTLVGFATVQDTFDVGVGGTVITADVQAGRIGLNTATPEYNVHISNVGSGSTTLYVDGGDVKIAGDIYADNLALPGGSITVDNLYVSGFSTFVNALNIDGDVDLDANLHLTGVSTFVGDISITGNVLQTGIITATEFHGDGSNLTGTARNLTATIGIKSEGSFIGAGITQIDFSSSNGSGIAVDVQPAAPLGVATVTVTTGISIGLAIALGG